MFDRRRVRFVRDSAFDLLTPDERRAVKEGEVTRIGEMLSTQQSMIQKTVQ